MASLMLEIREKNNKLVIRLRVSPNAKSSVITGLWQNSLKISVNAPPFSGKANKACIELLSTILKISKKNIVITKGLSSRNKEVSLTGISNKELLDRLSLTP